MKKGKAMANPSKQKGTRAETKVAAYLCERGIQAERRPLKGASDMGDLRAFLADGTEITVEVKAGKQTFNPLRPDVEVWKRQTIAESANAGCPGALVIVRYRRLIENAEVWLPVGQWISEGSDKWAMMYLNEFAKEYGKKMRRRY